MGLEDLLPDPVRSEAPQHRHRLHRCEDEVVAGDRLTRTRPPAQRRQLVRIQRRPTRPRSNSRRRRLLANRQPLVLGQGSAQVCFGLLVGLAGDCPQILRRPVLREPPPQPNRLQRLPPRTGPPRSNPSQDAAAFGCSPSPNSARICSSVTIPVTPRPSSPSTRPAPRRLPARRVVRGQRRTWAQTTVMCRHRADQVQVPVPRVQHVDRHHGHNCSYHSEDLQEV